MRNFMIVTLAFLVLLALIVGVAGFLLTSSPSPGLSLSSSTVPAGGPLPVGASRLPANQSGEIDLHSVLQTFPFTADGNGNADIEITVAPDSALGDHTISVCWSGSHPTPTNPPAIAALSSPRRA